MTVSTSALFDLSLLLSAAAVGTGAFSFIRRFPTYASDELSAASFRSIRRSLLGGLLIQIGFVGVFSVLLWAVASLLEGTPSGWSIALGFAIGSALSAVVGFATQLLVAGRGERNPAATDDSQPPRETDAGSADGLSLPLLLGGVAMLGLIGAMWTAPIVPFGLVGFLLGSVAVSLITERPAGKPSTSSPSTPTELEPYRPSIGAETWPISAYELLVLATAGATLVAFSSPILLLLSPASLLAPLFLGALAPWVWVIAPIVIGRARKQGGVPRATTVVAVSIAAGTVTGSLFLGALVGLDPSYWMPFAIGGLVAASIAMLPPIPGSFGDPSKSSGANSEGVEQDSSRSKPQARVRVRILVRLGTLVLGLVGGYYVGGETGRGGLGFVPELGAAGIAWTSVALSLASLPFIVGWMGHAGSRPEQAVGLAEAGAAAGPVPDPPPWGEFPEAARGQLAVASLAASWVMLVSASVSGSALDDGGPATWLSTLFGYSSRPLQWIGAAALGAFVTIATASWASRVGARYRGWLVAAVQLSVLLGIGVGIGRGALFGFMAGAVLGTAAGWAVSGISIGWLTPISVRNGPSLDRVGPASSPRDRSWMGALRRGTSASAAQTDIGSLRRTVVLALLVTFLLFL